MTRLSGAPADERMLPLMQAQHNEKQAATYFKNAIRDGQAHQLLTDLNTLDAMLRELGIQDTDKCPVEVIRKLQGAALGAMREP